MGSRYVTEAKMAKALSIAMRLDAAFPEPRKAPGAKPVPHCDCVSGHMVPTTLARDGFSCAHCKHAVLFGDPEAIKAKHVALVRRSSFKPGQPRKGGREGYPLRATSVETGEVREYRSINEAHVAGFHRANIHRALKHGKPFLGFRWERIAA